MTNEKSLWVIFYAPDPYENVMLCTRMSTEEELRASIARFNATAEKKGNRKAIGAIRIPTIGERIDFEVKE